MRRMILQRDPFAEFGTTGILRVGDEELFTLERPWIPTDPGGKPFDSCVPAGLYRLTHYQRPSGADAFALVNKGLGVFHQDKQRKRKIGRYLIAIHAANYVDELMGCIAPGMRARQTRLGPSVLQSRFAMTRIVKFKPKEILILDAR